MKIRVIAYSGEIEKIEWVDLVHAFEEYVAEAGIKLEYLNGQCIITVADDADLTALTLTFPYLHFKKIK